MIDLSAEIKFKTSRSGGKGGQHVNKVSSKTELVWECSASMVLTDEEKVAACDAAKSAGADFVKTSTGKTPRSATLEATGIMLRAIRETGDSAGRRVGLKPSGGIRTVADAAAYLQQADDLMGSDWVTPSTFRFGASGLLDALIAALDEPAE